MSVVKYESSPEYRERLKQWVLSELKRLKASDRKFASMLGLSYGAVQRWRRGGVKTELEIDSLESIARYKGQSVEEVRAWLEGQETSQCLPHIDWVQEIIFLRQQVRLS